MATTFSYRGGPDSIRRRSQRVVLSLPVTIGTEDAAKEASFEEQTRTLVVNVHGALVALSHHVEVGQKLRLTNRVTKQEQRCQVVYLGPASGGETQIAIEFLNPSPDFWHIAFPPEDWVLPETISSSSNSE